MDAGVEVGHQKKFGDDLVIIVFDGHYVTRNVEAMSTVSANASFWLIPHKKYEPKSRCLF